MARPVKAYIPEQSSPQIEKFINCLMKDGKKAIARRVFKDTLEVIKTRTKEDPLEVFNKALLNVTPMVEVRPKRVAGSVYQVPVEVPPKRQQALSFRWILGRRALARASPCLKNSHWNCWMHPPNREEHSRRSRTSSRWRRQTRRLLIWRSK
jgi:ribosomal protein S7